MSKASMYSPGLEVFLGQGLLDLTLLIYPSEKDV